MCHTPSTATVQFPVSFICRVNRLTQISIKQKSEERRKKDEKNTEKSLKTSFLVYSKQLFFSVRRHNHVYKCFVSFFNFNSIPSDHFNSISGRGMNVLTQAIFVLCSFDYQKYTKIIR